MKNNQDRESSTLLVAALRQSGFVVEELLLAGKKYYLVSLQGRSIMISAHNPLYPFATASARTIYKHKVRSLGMAERAGLPVSKTLQVRRGDALEWSVLDPKYRYVVKPTAGAGGQGVTVGVQSEAQLQEAIATAHVVSDTALVQPQFYGEEYRFTVVNGKVVSILERHRPEVTGDGVSSVARLVEIENGLRRQIDTLVPYPDLSLEAIPIARDTVLKSGEKVLLNSSTMIRGGASIYDAADRMHGMYTKKVEDLARAFGNGLLAVDLLIEDSRAAPSAENYIFLEMNAVPALALYYSERHGNHFDIINKYLVPMFRAVVTGANT